VKQLIVNADDFGLTESVNRGILDAHRDGIVTSATLMANGYAFDSAVAASKRFYRLGIGVHLNLTEGTPVADARQIRTLVDTGGRLHMTPARLWAGIATGRVSLADIEFELRAQINKVMGTGLRPTHFDGHKHIHVLPGVSEIVIRLAKEFGVPAVRCPMEQIAHASLQVRNHGPIAISRIKQYLVSRAVSAMARNFRRKLEQTGLLSPARFYGISDTGFLDASAIRRILASLPPGVSELMCHPGYRDIDLERTRTRLLTQREIEIQGLTAVSVKNLVVSEGIQLGTFIDFVASAQQTYVAA
jgi:hopanoid biosynthesis associated protein HpnK